MRLHRSRALLIVLSVHLSSCGDSFGGGDGADCRTSADCTEGMYPECFLPEAIQFPSGACGYCDPEVVDECATDQDCGSGSACRNQGACACGGQQRICVPGCSTDAECLRGQTCDAAAHCVATVCATRQECPAQFDCSAGACARRTCSGDDDCRDGTCVTGMCFDEPGTCGQNAPVP